jgi:hypothetical protein
MLSWAFSLNELKAQSLKPKTYVEVYQCKKQFLHNHIIKLVLGFRLWAISLLIIRGQYAYLLKIQNRFLICVALLAIGNDQIFYR